MKVTGPAAMLIGILLLGILIAIPVLLLVGAAEVSAAALGWMPWIFAIVAGAGLLAFGLPALVAGRRGRSGIGFLLTATVLGALLWIWSLAFTYEAWGIIPVIIGLLLAGIGIVPVALAAALFEGAWTTLALLLALIACIYGFRVVGTRLLGSAAARGIPGLRNRSEPCGDESGVVIEGSYREVE